VPSCPPLVGYTKEEQADVADKMLENPQESWVKMIEDYGRLRKTIREICDTI
jgi:hypothetical protein